MESALIAMRDGLRIYTEYCITDENMPTMIYLHGGPGQGCWDFQYVAKRISNFCNVISFDQRGVLRSDPVNESFTSEQLIEDIEGIRIHFGIQKIILCGHSYGGQLILRYALKYPQRIERLIYVCPSFSFLDSMRNVYWLCRTYYAEAGNIAELQMIDEHVADDREEVYLSGLSKISDSILEKVYYGNPIPLHVKKDIFSNSAKKEDWAKGVQHADCIYAEREIFRNYLSHLQQIHSRSLLIVGDHDPICCEIQQTCFLKQAQNERIIMHDAGHSLYVENADAFVAIIEDYLKDYSREIVPHNVIKEVGFS